MAGRGGNTRFGTVVGRCGDLDGLGDSPRGPVRYIISLIREKSPLRKSINTRVLDSIACIFVISNTMFIHVLERAMKRI